MQTAETADGAARPVAAAAVMAVASATIFFDALDLSITQIALPGIQASLDVSTSTLPWIAAAYVVPYGGFLLLGGRATDLLGARLVLITGLALFGGASLACGVAPNAGWLIAARATQGVGAALTVPAAVALLASAFPDGPARARAFGVFSAAGASGFTAGLVLGGVITSGLSWRWIFLAKVPAVAITLLTAARAIRRSPRRRSGGSYDLGGAATVTAAAVLVTYGITRAGDPSASGLSIMMPLLLAVVFFAMFLRIERRADSPLLPTRLLSRRIAAADGAALAVLAAPFGISFLVTLFLQDVLHRSAWETATTLLPGSALSAVVAHFVAPRLLNRLGLRAVYAGGLVIVAAGNGLLLALDASSATWLIVVAGLVSLGAGMGLAYPAATFAGLTGVDADDQGAAAGLNNTALQIGGGLGLAVIGAVVSMTLNGKAIGHVSVHTAETAVRYGALATTVLPLLGAAVVLLGLRRPSRESVL